MCKVRHFGFVPYAVLSIIFIFCAISAGAADIREKLAVPQEGNTQVLELSDGTSVRGEIIEVGEETVRFQTEMGELTIDIAKIVDVKEISKSQVKGGKIWFPNPNKTRLFFSSNGRLLEQGQGYFSLWYLFFPSVNYGVTDNISVGAGVSIFPGLSIPDEQFIFLTPKVGLNLGGNIDFAVSFLLIRLPDFDDDDDPDDDDDIISFDEPEYIGTLNLLGTMGSSDHNFTVGLGYGYAGDDWADKPYVIVGGETRIARKMSLLGESWLLPGVDAPLVSYGVRFFGEGLAVDLAFLTAINEDAIFPGIPFLGFVYNF